jgi:hypothetical protein
MAKIEEAFKLVTDASRKKRKQNRFHPIKAWKLKK